MAWDEPVCVQKRRDYGLRANLSDSKAIANSNLQTYEMQKWKDGAELGLEPASQINARCFDEENQKQLRSGGVVFPIGVGTTGIKWSETDETV